MASARVRSDLERAIEGQYVVSIRWKGERRVVYVHRMWESEDGGILIEVWQAKGPSKWRKYVGWKTIRLDDVTEVVFTGALFEEQEGFIHNYRKRTIIEIPKKRRIRDRIGGALRCLSPRNAAEAARCAFIRLTDGPRVRRTAR